MSECDEEGEEGQRRQRQQVSSATEGSGPSMLVMGGWDGGAGIFSDLQTLELGACEWRGAKVLPPPTPTPARFAHACCVCERVIFVFGGMNARSDLNDLLAISKVDA